MLHTEHATRNVHAAPVVCFRALRISMAFSLCVWLALLGVSADYLIADTGNHRIQLCPELSPGAACLTVAGTGIAGTGLTQLDTPTTVALDENGDFVIQDVQNNRILVCPEASPGTDCTALFTPILGHQQRR